MIKAIIDYLSDWRAENPEHRVFIILSAEDIDEDHLKINSAMEGTRMNLINLLASALEDKEVRELIIKAMTILVQIYVNF